MNEPDSLLRFRLFTADEVPRPLIIHGHPKFLPVSLGVPDGHNWDCRIWLGDLSVELGMTYTLGIHFLSPIDALDEIVAFRDLKLIRGAQIGVGQIVV